METNIIISNLVKELTYDPKAPIIFSSGLFLFLFTGFIFIYYLLRSRQLARIAFVTVFSYYFYYKSSGLYVLLLAFVTISDYLIAKAIQWCRDRRMPLSRQKLLLALSLVIDLGLLCYFKYNNFFAGIFAAIIGYNFQPWDIFLPVGISFFSFQSMSYTIDVFRGRLKPLDTLFDYAFYVSFFPQLVAGPIVRATDFAPQIRRRVCVSETMLATGIFMIVAGLLKKAVISDYISLNFVDRVFANPHLYSGLENLLGLYGYTLQIYCDFSGYSDMAIGLALLLGFHFPANFNAPFKAVSVSDFWHRWHISLSSWIKDYVYIFWLGGNRKGKVRTYLNLMLAMLLCGLWHGASFNFIIWGGLHGVALACHKLTSQKLFHHERHYESKGWRRYGAIFVTFQFVAFMFMIFRMSSWEGMQAMLTQIFTDFHLELLPKVAASYKYILLIMLMGFTLHFLPHRWNVAMVALLKRGGVVLDIVVLVVAIYIVIQVKSSEIQPFIYFQF